MIPPSTVIVTCELYTHAYPKSDYKKFGFTEDISRTSDDYFIKDSASSHGITISHGRRYSNFLKTRGGKVDIRVFV